MADSDLLVGAELREAKQTLRARVIDARDALDPAWRASASRIISERIAALPSFVAARTVLLTLSFRSEWDTAPLIAAAFAAGKTVAVPRVDAATRMLSLHALDAPDVGVMPGYRGIPEPQSHCPAVATAAIDWILVPGVAFDSAGRRLGYGGGFYDRLVPLFARSAPRVAGAYDMQILAQVPAAPHDHDVDLLVTETRTIVTAAPPSGDRE